MAKGGQLGFWAAIAIIPLIFIAPFPLYILYSMFVMATPQPDPPEVQLLMKVVVTGEVDGQPVSGERKFTCESYRVKHEGCLDCLKWRPTVSLVEGKISDNQSLIVDFADACPKKVEMQSYSGDVKVVRTMMVYRDRHPLAGKLLYEAQMGPWRGPVNIGNVSGVISNISVKAVSLPDEPVIGPNNAIEKTFGWASRLKSMEEKKNGLGGQGYYGGVFFYKVPLEVIKNANIKGVSEGINGNKFPKIYSDGHFLLIDFLKHHTCTKNTPECVSLIWAKYTGDGAWKVLPSSEGAAIHFIEGEGVVSRNYKHNFRACCVYTIGENEYDIAQFYERYDRNLKNEYMPSIYHVHGGYLYVPYEVFFAKG